MLASQDKVLERVRDRRIDRSRLTPFEDGNVVSGGYGNVWFATLDQGYSNSVHVAAKELRQGGNIGERIRVAIVSAFVHAFPRPC